MPRHDWERLPATLEVVRQHGWGPHRQCKLCGAFQTRVQETAWGRVTGYRWWPLVGRCPGKKKGDG